MISIANYLSKPGDWSDWQSLWSPPYQLKWWCYPGDRLSDAQSTTTTLRPLHENWFSFQQDINDRKIEVYTQ